MHHKRKRPKNSRAGCLLCKPWKANGIKGTGDARPMQERRSELTLREGIRDMVTGVVTGRAAQESGTSEEGPAGG